MAEAKTLAATVRSRSGKGAARGVRREGRVPGVIYGGGEPAKAIAVDYRELNQLIYGGRFLTTIFEIDVEGQRERVIPRDFQLDVIKDTPLHVDFLRLKAGSRLKIEVPVHFVNQDICPGIKRGGSLNVVRHSIEMYVPADAIPEAVTADLATLNFNDSLHISAIKLPEGCQPTIAERDFTVASITPPTTITEEAPTPAEGAPVASAVAPTAAASEAKAAAPAKGGAAPPASAPAAKK